MTAARPTRQNPFVGPRSFERGERLFGRAAALQRLLSLLIAERIVLLYSPSGAGKTSLIQSALIPALEAEAFFVLPVMRVGAETPRSSNDDLLASLLGAPAPRSRYLASALASLDARLHADDPTPTARLADLSLSDYLRERTTRPRNTLGRVLIFDQFEEILTVDPTNEAARIAFFRMVGEALRDRSLWALFALREDYLAGLDPYLRPIPTRFANTFRLDLLDAAAAGEAMRAPAWTAGVTFAAQAAARLVDDLRTVRVQLPDGRTELRLGAHIEPVQLQVVCYRLWEQLFPPDGGGAHPPTITAADVATVKDVDNALAEYYAQRVATTAVMTGASERRIRDWFDRQLITPGGIRGQVVRESQFSGGLANSAVAALVDAHLVRAEQRGGATWYELAHDRLIEPVRESNAYWREANLSTLQRQSDLWEKRGRPDGLLLSGAELRAAEAWAAEAPLVTEVEQAFLEECRQARAAVERERRTSRIIRGLSAIALFLAVAAGLAALFAWQQRGEALANFQQAEEQRQTAVAAEATSIARRDAAERQSQAALSSQARLLAAEALEASVDNSQLAMLLALEADARDPGPRSEEALRRILADNSRFGRELPHQAAVVGLAFSPDGARLITADGQVRIWAVDGSTEPRTLSLLDDESALTSAAWSPDGLIIATGGGAEPPVLWDAGSGAPIKRLDNAPDAVTGVRFSPDGLRLLAFSSDGFVAQWEVATGARVGALISVLDGLSDAAWLAKSDRIVTAGPAGTVIWESDTGREIADLPAGEIAPYAVATSPDGQRLALVDASGNLLLWEPAGTAVIQRVSAHDGAAFGVAVSPDGVQVATVGDDGYLRTWNAASLAPMAELEARRETEDSLVAVAFSPEGNLLATGSDVVGGAERTALAQIWDLGLPTFEASETALRAASFSDDGLRFATAGDDGVVRIWDTRSGALLFELDNQSAEVIAVAFTPDGRLLTAARDGTVRHWGPTWEVEWQIETRGVPLLDLAIGPDGRQVAGAGADGTLWVWQVSDGTVAQRIDAHNDAMTSVAFSPDGTQLLTAGLDSVARLWELDGGRLVREFEAPAEGVARAVFSADGKHILTASRTGVYQWEIEGDGEPKRVTSDAEPIIFVAASPDDKLRIVTVGETNGVRLWDADARVAVQLDATTLSQGVAFSPNGRYLLTYTLTGDVGLTYAHIADVRAALRWRTERELTDEERARYLGEN